MAPLIHDDFAASPTETTTSHNSASGNGSHDAEGLSPIDEVPPLQKRVTPPAQHGLNPRSCITCRKRKVKCDKKLPCSNCSKTAIECIYPGPGRAPRRPRKPQDTELLERLKKLEGLVKNLGHEDDETSLGEAALDPRGSPIMQGESASKPTSCSGRATTGHYDSSSRKEKSAEGDLNGVPVKEFGRLVVDEGRSRYVSNKFWASLSEEVTELQGILDDPSEEEEDYPVSNPSSIDSADHQGFIFGFSSTALSLRRFHPPSEQTPVYWSIYKENIDPVMKVLHIPTMETTFFQATQDLDHVSKPLEALIFSIYYASVTSLSSNECWNVLGVDKEETLRQYHFAVEQAFSRANFLSTQEIFILQAMLIFLTCVSRTDDTRYVWTLTALLIRLAQALGIHRDGAQFKVSPFETELRRRLWWHIYTLDVRSSENHGCDPTINETAFDTKFPSNTNDIDIYPSMKEPPRDREGVTDMTFDLIRYTICTAFRRLSYAPVGPEPCKTKNASMTLADREKVIEELHQRLENEYLRFCDTKNVPLHWVAATVARLVLAKMWLLIHHPFVRTDCRANLSRKTKERLFNTSIEVIQFSRLLETEQTTMKWGWLVRTYTQWQALSFLSSELCTRTSGPDVDRAWGVIEEALESWDGVLSSTHNRGRMWKPLRKLIDRARTERAKALRQRATFPLDGSLGPSLNANGATSGPLNFDNTPFYPIMNGVGGALGFTHNLSSVDPMAPLTSVDGESTGARGSATYIDSWDPDPVLFTPEPSLMLADDMNGSDLDGLVNNFDIGSTYSDGGGINGNTLEGQKLTSWI